jgi:L-ribulose-5-phosphate 3-epimerase
MQRRHCLQTLAAAATLAGFPGQAWSEGKGRFRAAICAYSFRNQLQNGSLTYEALIRMAAELGADGVDLTTYWLHDTNDQTLFALKRAAYRSGISLYNIGVRVRLAQPTAELQTAEVETVRKWLDVAERLGASGMRIFGGAVPKGATDDQAVAWAVETLKRSADEAAKRGITLGVEDDGGITTNADRTIEIVKKAGSPWVGINLDIGNFPDDGYAQIEMCAPYATNVHFKTEVHVERKSQPADWPRVLKILGAAGYQGYLALEYEQTEDPMTVVPKLIGKMRETIRAAS